MNKDKYAELKEKFLAEFGHTSLNRKIWSYLEVFIFPKLFDQREKSVYQEGFNSGYLTGHIYDEKKLAKMLRGQTAPKEDSEPYFGASRCACCDRIGRFIGGFCKKCGIYIERRLDQREKEIVKEIIKWAEKEVGREHRRLAKRFIQDWEEEQT